MITERQNQTPLIRIPRSFSVFCDLDGTLIDTDRANYLAYRRAVKEVTNGFHDVDYTRERLNRDTLKTRLPSLTASQVEEIVACKSEYFTEFLSDTKLNTELARVITEHRDTNKIYLVTQCRERRAIQVLDHHKLLNCFTQLVCLKRLNLGVSSNKYEAALALTGEKQDAVLVFENDEASVKEAMLAGVPRRNIYIVAFMPGEAS